MMVRAPEDRTIDTLTRWATSKCGDRIESPLISSADPMPRGAIGGAAFGPHMIHRSSQAGGGVEKDCSRLTGGSEEVRSEECLHCSTFRMHGIRNV